MEIVRTIMISVKVSCNHPFPIINFIICHSYFGMTFTMTLHTELAPFQVRAPFSEKSNEVNPPVSFLNTMFLQHPKQKYTPALFLLLTSSQCHGYAPYKRFLPEAFYQFIRSCSSFMYSPLLPPILPFILGHVAKPNLCECGQ